MDTSWALDTEGTEVIEVQVITGKKKKRADPFVNFFKAGRPVTRVRHTKKISPEGWVGVVE